MTQRPVALAIALAFAASASLTACDSTASLTEQEHIQRAKDFEDKGQLKGSILELKNAVQKNPDSPQARLLLGQVYLKSGMGAAAEKELTRAEKLGVNRESIKPHLGEALLLIGEYKRVLDEIQPGEQTSKANLARIWQLRADALLKLGQVKDACTLYQQSLDIDRRNPSTYRGLAECSIAESDILKAREWLDAALKLDPKFTEALFLKGALLESESKPDDAINVYRKMLVDDPAQFRAHLAIAGLQLEKGDLEGADKAIQTAESLAGKDPLVKYARGTLELKSGNFAKASSAYHGVLQSTNHLPSMLGYAMASHGQGNHEQSINYAGKVLGAAPGNLVATKVLASSKLESGDIEGARKILDAHLAKYPYDSGLLALAGDAHLRTGDYNKAMRILDKAAEMEPGNAAIKTRQATGRLAMGDSRRALADLEAAVSLSDKPGQADLALVMLHLNGQEYDKAIQAISSLEKKLPNNPVTHNLRGAALLGKEDRAGARKSLEQALAIEPKFLTAAVNLARLDIQDKKPEAARKRFESILSRDKNNARVMMALAELAAAQKQEKEHVSWLEKAAKANPKAIEPRIKLVRHYLAIKENQKAISLARETSNANPDSLQAIKLLGTTQSVTGDNTSAIATFSRMTQIAPQSPEAYMSLALAQGTAKQLVKARESLKKAVQLKPDYINAQDALMRLELADKKPEAALQIARQMQTRQPQSPLGFDREADILLSQKRFPQAIKAYEHALAKEASGASLVKLHRALTLSGDTKSAEQRLNGWVQLNPKDVIVRAYAAEFYMLAQRDRDAIAQYEAVLKLAPGNAVTLNNLASLYLRTDDNRALSVAEQAYKLAPEHPSIQDTLGWILVEQGKTARGLNLLREAVNKAPNAPVIRYHYAVALSKAGKKPEAKKELEQAINSGQEFPELNDAKLMLKTL